jgi:hypothetical protein
VQIAPSTRLTGSTHVPCLGALLQLVRPAPGRPPSAPRGLHSAEPRRPPRRRARRAWYGAPRARRAARARRRRRRAAPPRRRRAVASSSTSSSACGGGGGGGGGAARGRPPPALVVETYTPLRDLPTAYTHAWTWDDLRETQISS